MVDNRDAIDSNKIGSTKQKHHKPADLELM
jgi:hypothetical protein